MAYLHLFWKPQALTPNKVDFVSYPYGKNVRIKMSFQFVHSSLKTKKLILCLLLCAFMSLCVLVCAGTHEGQKGAADSLELWFWDRGLSDLCVGN